MTYDAIIVLAGGIRDDGSLPPSVCARVQKAKELYDDKKSSRIIMSGRWSVYREKHIPPMTEAEAMSRYARSIGIPATKIYKEEKSNTTQKNAYFVQKQFLKPKNWKKIVVITSSFHIPRTKHIFNELLGPSYTITYVASSTPFDLKKWITWHIVEKLSLMRLKSMKQ